MTVIQLRPESNEATENKFIVFESCLDDLLRKCVQCGCDGYISKKSIGTCVVVSVSCLKCEFVRTWNSQPMTGTRPYGNLIISAAVLFSGVSPVKFLRLLDFAAIENICISTYNNIQSSYLTPSVMSVWSRSQQMLLDEIREDNRSVRLAGDAKCCSPGHTAKFGSYSLLDLDTAKILDFKLVQVCPIKKEVLFLGHFKGIHVHVHRHYRNATEITISWLKNYAYYHANRMPDSNDIMLLYKTEIYKTYRDDMIEDLKSRMKQTYKIQH